MKIQGKNSCYHLIIAKSGKDVGFTCGDIMFNSTSILIGNKDIPKIIKYLEGIK